MVAGLLVLAGLFINGCWSVVAGLLVVAEVVILWLLGR